MPKLGGLLKKLLLYKFGKFYQNQNCIICLFKLDILWFFMMFEFPAYRIKQFEKSDLFLGNLFWDTTPNGNANFKHHKKSENVKFEETNNAVSILSKAINKAGRWRGKGGLQKKPKIFKHYSDWVTVFNIVFEQPPQIHPRSRHLLFN